MRNEKNCKCSQGLWNKYNSRIIPVVPDIKCKSPGEGDLMMGRDPVFIAKSMEMAGAPVISVVTEFEHFGGSAELLEKITQAVSVPVLRKDFINTKEQVKESADMGASGILLISSMLKREQLYELIEESYKLGLEPLVETHNEDEILAVRDLDLTFLGINNRNIIEWEMDGGNVNTTEKLAGVVPAGALLISESSIFSPEDVSRAVEAGAHAVLVGTAVLKAMDTVEMYNKLSLPRR